LPANTIAVDAMGGDHGPAVVVPAALYSLQQYDDLRLILVGDQEILKQQLNALQARENERLQIQHASQQVAMDESPAMALRTKKDSSMRVAINLVKEGIAKACVSAGNTGALMATAKFVLKTPPGIDRPAIIYSMPTMQEGRSVRLLDLGANVDSQAEHLLQFAIMGSILAEAVDNIKTPSVGLLNIGKEDIKGNEQVKLAAQLFLQTQSINYIGYIEGDEIYKGVADVVVCDGFVGNVALKVTEGVAKMITHYMKNAFNRNWLTRLSGLAALHVLKSFAKQIDPSRYNGASLVGLQGIVIKSHGGANKVAFANAIKEARLEAKKNVPQLIRDQMEVLLQSTEG
jgi:glycerol-3-phosphate acyltransferase PlsX